MVRGWGWGGIVMRRVITAMVVAAMLSTVGAATASAGDKQHSQFFYGSWRSQVRVDADTVDREDWYLDAYWYGDEAFGFVYHTVYRCTKTDGHTRCHRSLSEYGRVRGLTQDQFTIDKKLNSMHLATTIRLRSNDEVVRKAEVTVDLAGTGEMTRSKESYSYRQGCELYKFNGHRRYRDAEGEPIITVEGVAQNVGRERYATIGVGDSISIEKEC
jgi:hypothetical protein